jgi:hypothetical protein
MTAEDVGIAAGVPTFVVYTWVKSGWLKPSYELADGRELRWEPADVRAALWPGGDHASA